MRLAHIGFLAATGAVLLGSSADLFAQSRVVGKPQARLNGGPRTRKPTNIHASPTPVGSLANPRATLPSASLIAATTNIAFQTTRQISTGLSPVNDGPTAPYLSSLGDFDGNGTADVASFVQDSDNSFWLSILLSNGDGTFQSPVLTGVVFDGSGLMAAADLNADGKCDVVFVGSNSVDVLIGNGDGTFQPAVNYATQISNPAAVALVDTNNDTLIDIIIANGFVPIPLHINGPIAHGVPDANATNPVATLLGTGGGLFAEPVIAHYNGTMNYGVFADIDGDGRLDLVSSSQVFLGTPTDYQPPITLTASSSMCWAANGSVAVADMNGDGLPDIITAECLNQAIIVFPN